jgi:putative membrane protein
MDKAAASELIDGDASTELSSNRTSLSFERTRMSADRTLMSIVRTSLSLISFGFTIHEVFAKSTIVPGANRLGTNFGLALLTMGVVLLAAGVFGHTRFSRGLTGRRERLHGLGLLRTAIQYTATPTYAVALALLITGVATIAAILFRSLD